jgi:hypothetical protein
MHTHYRSSIVLLSVVMCAGTALSGCACAGTRSSQSNPRVIFKHRDIANGPVKGAAAFITWRNYDGIDLDGTQNAEYVYCGNVVGKGDAGFAVILEKLRALPAGSVVLIFPNWETLEELETSGPQRCMPWNQYNHALTAVAENGKLTYVVSPYDEKGRLDPSMKGVPGK